MSEQKIKGFIEISEISEILDETLIKSTININHIGCFTETYDREYTYISFRINAGNKFHIFAKESYEEIKQKIREAQK